MQKKCIHIVVNLLPEKISKSDAIRCEILRPKCTKFDFRCGSAPYPAGGAYSAPRDQLAVFKGPTSKEKEGQRKGEGEAGREGRRGEGICRTNVKLLPIRACTIPPSRTFLPRDDVT